jgi:hypothetical protein
VRSFRRLVRTQTKAFGTSQGRPFARALLGARCALALVAYHRRADDAGLAVCLLRPRLYRVATGALALLLALCVLGAVAPVALIVLTAVCTVAMAPAAARAARAVPAQMALRRLSPPGKHIYLHSLASCRPGAGAELLSAVIGEAGQKGWSLLLDAACEGLVPYYRRFGFVVLGAAMVPGTGLRTRMWRPASNDRRPC